jgi:hypothetical protein
MQNYEPRFLTPLPPRTTSPQKPVFAPPGNGLSLLFGFTEFEVSSFSSAAIFKNTQKTENQ